MSRPGFCRWDVLKVAQFGLALALSPVPGHAQDLDALVREAARQVAIPPSWIRAVLRIESAGDRQAISSAGAMGLMQIMPGTWRDLRHALNLGADPFDPHDNIVAGAAYLRWLHDRYGDAGFLAAYNAGPGRYDEHLATGRPLPDETRIYVDRVVRTLTDGIASSAPLQGERGIPAWDWQRAVLFAVPFVSTSGAGALHPAGVSRAPPPMLFVRRNEGSAP
ncbi:lytic transglycosylase domain-containing protein [Brytella acorum]|uniref:Lytic transglycosylase domain-containing protein n=1 Tax=Brytella acorum TaxID=2959299 RepID=A0AA35VEW5_9PROT|nr:lytic transglycosylase domain-containing protein [Brytella acorum]CAI9121926.1 lytic transglycosylase domain-containing protein [Brytella acorum]